MFCSRNLCPVPEVSLSGINFETKNKRIVVEASTWRWLVDDQPRIDLTAFSSHLYFQSHLAVGSISYLFTVSGFLFFLFLVVWGSNNQKEDMHFNQWNVCFKFQKYFWRKSEILGTSTSFFLFKPFTRVYTHTHTLIAQKLCCGNGYFFPLGSGS